MKCPKCEFQNHENARYCRKCGANLQTEPAVKTTPSKSSNYNKNLLIVCITIIICIALVCGVLYLNHDNKDNTPLNTTNTENMTKPLISDSMISYDCGEFSLTVPSSWIVAINSKAEANGCIGSVKEGSQVVAWLFIVDYNPTTLDYNKAATYLSSYSYSYLSAKTIGSHNGFISDAHPNGKSVTQEAFIFIAHGKAYMIVMNTGDYGKEAYKVVEGFK